MKPTLYFLVGLPASGKSTFAKHLVESNNKVIVHSSDAIREELFGDANIQKDNDKVFAILHKRITNDLSNGKDVCYDACNISKKRRIHFLKSLCNIKCEKRCVCFISDITLCIVRNRQRKRVVPEEVIKKMYLNWTPPHTCEGFDIIDYITDDEPCDVSDLFALLDTWMKFNQNNPHHSLTLGQHLISTVTNLHSNDVELVIAALFHDIGKTYCKTYKNCKGKRSAIAHYYNHNNVSAYLFLSLFIDSNIVPNHRLQEISNYIYYHMHPYLAWKNSNKSLERDTKLMGEAFIKNVYLLHEADVNAH